MEYDRRENLVQNFPILGFLHDSEEPPLDRLAIEELELVLGVLLPADYVDFLLAFNGGRLEPWAHFDMPHPTTFVSGGALPGFFGEPGNGVNGLGAYSKMFRDRLPENYLAIADGPSQDLVVLKFHSPREFAGVWYWNSSAFWISEEEQSMYWVADTFHGFLRMLTPDVALPTETTDVYQAIEQNDSDAVRRFLSKGRAIEERNDRGWTLLTCAAHYGYPRVVKLLLEHGADPHARDHKGKTPLHHAAKASLDCVKLLLAAGADIKARDNEGHGVVGNWYYRADKYLREHGAEE
ncbi:MAG TPA: ankyrin repeat domain-containing protein [Pirellulales bacterium]|nr:ankyrin repeat domain-containing protein [Pirellulales bacterium]